MIHKGDEGTKVAEMTHPFAPSATTSFDLVTSSSSSCTTSSPSSSSRTTAAPSTTHTTAGDLKLKKGNGEERQRTVRRRGFSHGIVWVKQEVFHLGEKESVHHLFFLCGIGQTPRRVW